MKKNVLIFVLVILAFTIQSCVFPLMPFLSAYPNLLLIMTFSVGFMEGKNAGMLYGFFAGLLMDLFYSGPFGFYTLIFINIGYINGICTKYYYEDYITLPLLLSIVNELAYNIYVYLLRFLIRGRLQFFYYFKEIMLPEIIFTTVMTLLVYRLFLFTNRRITELNKRRDTRGV